MHHIPLRTVEEAEKDGKLSVTHHERYRLAPRIFATNWLDSEQQAQFHRVFAGRLGDPCRVCGWSSKSQVTQLPPPEGEAAGAELRHFEPAVPVVVPPDLIAGEE